MTEYQVNYVREPGWHTYSKHTSEKLARAAARRYMRRGLVVKNILVYDYTTSPVTTTILNQSY